MSATSIGLLHIIISVFRHRWKWYAAYCDRCYRGRTWSICTCLSHSCTLLKPMDGMRCHLAGTLMWSRVILLLDSGSSHPTGRFGGQIPQFAAMLPTAKLLWPSLFLNALLFWSYSRLVSVAKEECLGIAVTTYRPEHLLSPNHQHQSTDATRIII